MGNDACCANENRNVPETEAAPPLPLPMEIERLTDPVSRTGDSLVIRDNSKSQTEKDFSEFEIMLSENKSKMRRYFEAPSKCSDANASETVSQ